MWIYNRQYIFMRADRRNPHIAQILYYTILYYTILNHIL